MSINSATGAVLVATNATPGAYTVIYSYSPRTNCDKQDTAVFTVLTRDDITNTPITACDSAQVNGTWYYTSQTVVDNFTNQSGCDSVETTVVTINNRDDITNTPITACDSAQVNGTWYYASQTVVDNFTNQSGCDSVETTVVTINVSPTATLSLTDEVCVTDTAFALSGGAP